MTAKDMWAVKHRIAFVVGEYPEKEQRRRESLLHSYSDDHTEVGVVRASGSPYASALTAEAIARLVPAYLDGFKTAEEQGYDAVIPFGMYDLGVDGGKSQCHIPVVGPCQAALHLAGLIGERFGLVAYSADLVPTLRRLVRGYGMEPWVADFRHLGIPLNRLADDESEAIGRLERTCQAMVDDGADLIIPVGVTQCPVLVSAAELAGRLGVPVVDGISAPLQMAKALLATGQQVSRRAWPSADGEPTNVDQ